MKKEPGRFSRAGKGGRSPQDIIDQEMSGLTSEFGMTDLQRSPVIDMEQGNIPGFAEKQRELNDAMRAFNHNVETKVYRQPGTDDPNIEVFLVTVQGRTPGNYMNEMTFKMDKRCKEAQWLMKNIIGLAGGISS